MDDSLFLHSENNELGQIELLKIYIRESENGKTLTKQQKSKMQSLKKKFPQVLNEVRQQLQEQKKYDTVMKKKKERESQIQQLRV